MKFIYESKIRVLVAHCRINWGTDMCCYRCINTGEMNLIPRNLVLRNKDFDTLTWLGII
jgi:hypothetical protein